MKNFASTSTLLLVCAGCGLLSLGFDSCGGSGSGGSEMGADSGAKDGSAARDSSAAPESGSTVDASPHDAAAPETGDAAGWCGMPQTTLGMACDDCVATSCEATWCACAAFPVGNSDTGVSACQGYVQCVESCVATDGGSPTDCLNTVCAVPPFTPPEQQAGHSFLNCLVQYCGSSCGQ